MVNGFSAASPTVATTPLEGGWLCPSMLADRYSVLGVVFYGRVSHGSATSGCFARHKIIQPQQSRRWKSIGGDVEFTLAARRLEEP